MDTTLTEAFVHLNNTGSMAYVVQKEGQQMRLHGMEICLFEIL